MKPSRFALGILALSATLPVCLGCTATTASTSPETPGDNAATSDTSDTPADIVEEGDDSPAGGADSSSDDATENDTGSESESSSSTSDKPKAPPPSDDSRPTPVVARVVNDNRPAFKKCYEEARKKDLKLKGNIVLTILLDAAGKVKKANIDYDRSSIKLPEVGDCIIEVAKGLTYPASTKGLEKQFDYDFGFNNIPK